MRRFLAGCRMMMQEEEPQAELQQGRVAFLVASSCSNGRVVAIIMSGPAGHQDGSLFPRSSSTERVVLEHHQEANTATTDDNFLVWLLE